MAKRRPTPIKAADAPESGARKRKMSVGGYLEWIKQERPNEIAEWRVRVVAKTPRSPAAKAVWAELAALRGADMTVEAVFTSPRAKTYLAEAQEALGLVYGAEGVGDRMRLAKIKNGDQLPEQLNLGTKFAWAGRGDDPAEEPAAAKLGPKAARAADLAFNLLWDVSEPVTQGRRPEKRRQRSR